MCHLKNEEFVGLPLCFPSGQDAPATGLVGQDAPATATIGLGCQPAHRVIAACHA